jgi:hypothetical protein
MPSQEGLKAGSKGDLSGSMAEAMETAFKKEWRKYMGEDPPTVGADYRLLLFAAIAQGVVRHLVDQAREAFELEVVTTQVIDPTVTDRPAITSDNKDAITFMPVFNENRWQIEANTLVVEQRDSRKVVSEGKPTVAKIKYTDTLYDTD